MEGSKEREKRRKGGMGGSEKGVKDGRNQRKDIFLFVFRFNL